MAKAGTLQGTVRDPHDRPAQGALVELFSRLSGFAQSTRTGPDGKFVLLNIPPNTYALRVSLGGFASTISEVVIWTATPREANPRLAVASQHTSVTINAMGTNTAEQKSTASVTVDARLLSTLPRFSPDSGLNDAIIYTTPGVAADSNGFFHPLGDHAQVSYVIDGQPVPDQRNKVFSTSIPANAIQSMEVISGSPGAEYGDKTSLVINATTRSGLGHGPTGSIVATYGSFGSVGEEAAFGMGGPGWGNYLVANSERTGRFLDTPEFRPLHDRGNTGTVFDRVDFQAGARQALHLNLMASRNWMQIPNTYDQPRQDQRQKVLSFNAAPGYQYVFDAQSLLSVNAFYRRDQVAYYPSRDPLDDAPATLSQHRSLTNFGVHADWSRMQGRHNWKAGLNAVETRLNEDFHLGITDPAYNAVCLAGTEAVSSPGPRYPAQCAAAGYQPNPAFLGGLLPYDLSRGGQSYHFHGQATIAQAALFAQDSIRIGDLNLTLGLRWDRYDGLTRGTGMQPRAAFAYFFQRTNTVLRGGYSRTMETPTNENLVVSSSTGRGGLAGDLFQGAAEQRALALGRRNQYDAGVQQALGQWVIADVSYFRKYTRNAFDFDALFSSPVTLPIGWRQSKLDGVSARISTVDLHGLRVYATMGHANARFFGPENGGIIFNSNLAVGAYRQDHDQVYQQNVNLHYQRRKNGWWTDFTWRYDSGLVVGAVNDLGDALALTADQQATIGLYCGRDRASLAHRITNCTSPDYGADRIHILAPGTENDDHNPPRTKSRHILNAGVGTDNLFHRERLRTVVRFTVLNLTNQDALYNFLSPFSGTHWVGPRAYQAQVGWAF